jgi:hypothetical protein
MTGFVVVDGAMLLTTGILVILILFTSCFPAYAFIFRYSAWLVQTTSMLAFSAAPISLRRYFRSARPCFIDVVQPERFTGSSDLSMVRASSVG